MNNHPGYRSNAAGERRALTPEFIAEFAATLGVVLARERAVAAANGANPLLALLAQREATLNLEAEPADFLTQIERTKRR